MPLPEFLENIPGFFGRKDTQSIDFVYYILDNAVRKTIDPNEIVTLMANGDYRIFSEPIQDIAVYRSGKRGKRIFHSYVVFTTTSFCYSIERWDKFVRIQCATTLDKVIEFDAEEPRGLFYRETDWAQGHGNIWDMIRVIMQKKVFKKKFNLLTRNCQVFSEIVFKYCTSERIKFYKYRKEQPG